MKSFVRAGVSGFTLLELLIAMSLLGLIFAALSAGLRFGTTAWRAGAETLGHSDDLQVAHRVLHRQISATIDDPRAEKATFVGESDRLRLTGFAPARAMAAGIYEVTISLAADEESRALVLSWRPHARSNDVATPDAEPVIRGVRTLKFEYFGAQRRRERPDWHPRWEVKGRLPSAVRIHVDFADRRRLPWPPIVVPIGGHRG